VQYTGVITLCEINKQKHCPSGIHFDREPQKFISEWKAWWKVKQAK
jgi:hypothetical protein